MKNQTTQTILFTLCIAALFSGCTQAQPSSLNPNKQPSLSLDQSSNSRGNNNSLGASAPKKEKLPSTPKLRKPKESAPSTPFTDKYSQATLKTNHGDIIIEFFQDDAPITVNHFLKLSEQNFYDNTKFHRVIKDFMIQGGDPNSKDDDFSDDGTGGPGYKFDDEINSKKLVRGTLAMANSGPNTNGSQFFIVTAEKTPWLDGKHTVFGKVTTGMDIVDIIESAKTNSYDHPIDDYTVIDVELTKK